MYIDSRLMPARLLGCCHMALYVKGNDGGLGAAAASRQCWGCSQPKLVLHCMSTAGLLAIHWLCLFARCIVSAWHLLQSAVLIICSFCVLLAHSLQRSTRLLHHSYHRVHRPLLLQSSAGCLEATHLACRYVPLDVHAYCSWHNVMLQFLGGGRRSTAVGQVAFHCWCRATAGSSALHLIRMIRLAGS